MASDTVKQLSSAMIGMSVSCLRGGQRLGVTGGKAHDRLNGQHGDDTLRGGELTRLYLTCFGERPTVRPRIREANRSREQFESFAPLGPSVPGNFLARHGGRVGGDE